MQEHRSTFQHAGAQEHGSEFSAWMPMIPTVHVSNFQSSVSKLTAEVSMQEHRSTFQHAGAQEHGSEFSAWMPMIPTVHVSKLSFKAHSGSQHAGAQEHFPACRSTGAQEHGSELSASRGHRAARQLGGGWMVSQMANPLRGTRARIHVWIPSVSVHFDCALHLCTLSVHVVCALW